MGRIADKIVGIVKPFAEKRGVNVTSFTEGRLRAIGRALDAGSMTADQTAESINKECKSYLERQDVKDIAKVLNKLSH